MDAAMADRVLCQPQPECSFMYRSHPNLAAAAVLTLLLGLTVMVSPPFAYAEELLPVPGMVTMIDLGADKCIPCKMMAPILREVKNEYHNKAAIRFIDVWKSPDKAKEFGIRLIPTQIFYDARGREAFRHEGFMDKDAIVAQLQKLGVR